MQGELLTAVGLDLEEAAHGEVHDGGRDVDVVGRRVEQRSDLARQGALRGMELDGDGGLARSLTDVALLAWGGREAGRQAEVDVVAAVPAADRDEARDRGERAAARDGSGRGIDVERVAERQALLLDLLDAAEGSRREAGDDLHRLPAAQAVERVGGRVAGDARLALVLVLAAIEARDIGNGGRASHPDRDVLEGGLPGRADHVPVELVQAGLRVVGDDEALDVVGDGVVLGRGVDAVLVADAQQGHVALGLAVNPGRGAGGGVDVDVGVAEHVLLLGVGPVLLRGRQHEVGPPASHLREVHGEVDLHLGHALGREVDLDVIVRDRGAVVGLGGQHEQPRRQEGEQQCGQSGAQLRHALQSNAAGGYQVLPLHDEECWNWGADISEEERVEG